MGMVNINRFDILLISLDPSKGTEINKTRPCLVISPNEMNKYINTLIVAPMTSKIKNYPTRVPVTFDGKKGSTRPLRKLAYREEFEGDTERRTATYIDIREDSSTGSTYKLPLEVEFPKRSIVLDQIRTIDKSRIIKKLGTLDNETINLVFKTLEKIFT